MDEEKLELSFSSLEERTEFIEWLLKQDFRFGTIDKGLPSTELDYGELACIEIL